MNKPAPLSLLSEFLAEQPLYRFFGLNQPAEAFDLDGIQFNFFCGREREHHFFTLRLKSGNNGFAESGIEKNGYGLNSEGDTGSRFTELFEATCQSCKDYVLTLVIRGGNQEAAPQYFLQKIGQFPAPSEQAFRLPGELAAFLDQPGRELYGRGLRNLEQEFGLGAFIYFKKTAEQQFDRLLERMAGQYSVSGQRIREAFDRYEADHQKSTLIESIGPHLPEGLQRQGPGILVQIHDLACQPIPDLDETGYQQKAREIDLLFRHLLKRMAGKLSTR